MKIQGEVLIEVPRKALAVSVLRCFTSGSGILPLASFRHEPQGATGGTRQGGALTAIPS